MFKSMPSFEIPGEAGVLDWRVSTHDVEAHGMVEID